MGLFNTSITKAFLIGFAIVGTAYGSSTLKNNVTQVGNVGTVAAAEIPLRVAIAVSDSDNDGVEDWQEEFLDTPPIILADTSDVYVFPDTYTGKAGIQFFQGVLESKMYGTIARDEKDVINSVVEGALPAARDQLYDLESIVSIPTDGTTVRNYGNDVAQAILDHSNVDSRSELRLLEALLQNPNEDLMEALSGRMNAYRGLAKTMLSTPVPDQFVKEHLDLINSYTAVAKDIESMMLVDSDPMQSLVRLQRYEDDMLGLALSLQNIYQAIEPFAKNFTADDPALILVNFSDTLQ